MLYLGVPDSRACSKPFMIGIVADADVPLVSTTDPVGVHIEDGENIPLEISIGQSAGGADSLIERISRLLASICSFL
jgi:hypothetical protein